MKRFKSLFIQEDTSTVQEDSNNVKETSVENNDAVPTETKSNVFDLKVEKNEVSASEEIIEHLMNVLVEKTSVPIGHIKFIETVNSMELPNVPIETKFTIAFNTLKSTNSLTKDMLISSIEEDVQTLDNERNGYHQAIDDNLSIKLRKQKNLANELKNNIEELTQKIQELNTNLNELYGEQQTLSVEMNNTENEIEVKHKEFEASYNFVKNSLNGSLEKINNYIKE